MPVLAQPEKWPEAVQWAVMFAGWCAFLVPLAVAALLRRMRRLTTRALRGCVAASIGLLLLLNPMIQLITLGPVDAAIRSRWQTQAAAWPLVGMSPAEVVVRFGEPCGKREEAPAICGPSGCRNVGAPYSAWDYSPLSFFWLSHGFHFKIFFKNGRVSGFNRGG